MDITQWGIAGHGSVAAKFIKDLPLINNPKKQKVKAVLGHNTRKTVSFANEFGIPYPLIDISGLIKLRPDIVYIATPHSLHYEQALACLENKIPVLCEKPITINAEQCLALIRAAERNATFLMEGMWIRFLPSLQRVMDIINKGTIGNIIAVKASISYKAPQTDNRLFDPELGGGSLLDLGVYPIFLATILLKTPQQIKTIGKLTGDGIDVSCSMLFEYENGAYAMLESSLNSQMESPAEIIGAKGIIKILHPWFEKTTGIEVNIYDKGKTVYPCHWEGHGFQFEAEEALNCIRQGKISSELLGHDLSLKIMEIMDEVRRQIHVSYEMYE